EVAKSTKSVTLSGLTISKGSANGSTTFKGGGIYNAGTLTVSNSTLSYNTASNGGGGIANDGTLTVSGSTLSGNSSAAGGGIANSQQGTLTISGSTLSGNSASEGGGIENFGTVTVNNSSRITGNTALVGFGTDVYNLGVLYLDISSIIGTLDGNPARPI